MNKIQMVDLQSQYKNIKSEIDNAVIDVIESGQYINGPAVQEFSSNLAKYMSVKHVIPCANGTDALQVALMALDLIQVMKLLQQILLLQQLLKLLHYLI